MRSQCAVITLLLHRHVRLIALLEEDLKESAGTSDELCLVGYWLKGRLVQTVLEVGLGTDINQCCCFIVAIRSRAFSINHHVQCALK